MLPHLFHVILLSLAFSSIHSFFFRTVFLLLGLTYGSSNQGQAWWIPSWIQIGVTLKLQYARK